MSALPDAALALWRFTARERTQVDVLPDGCRDLVVVVPRQGAPARFVSALAPTRETPAFEAGDHAVGVRLRPGARLDEASLLALVAADRLDDRDLMQAVGAATRIDADMQEALACLGEAPSLAVARRRLGLSERSLERLLAAHTRRGPLWWRNLARARRCARALAGGLPLAHLAHAHGYADQAHMSRDLRGWFAATPTRMRATPAWLEALAAPAYP